MHGNIKCDHVPVTIPPAGVRTPLAAFRAVLQNKYTFIFKSLSDNNLLYKKDYVARQKVQKLAFLNTAKSTSLRTMSADDLMFKMLKFIT